MTDAQKLSSILEQLIDLNEKLRQQDEDIVSLRDEVQILRGLLFAPSPIRSMPPTVIEPLFPKLLDTICREDERVE